MPLIWTKKQDGEHNDRPRYEYFATCEDRRYHIVWSYDGGFGYTAIRADAEGRVHYLHPTREYATGITWARSLKNCKAMCEEIDARYMGVERTIFVPQIAGQFKSFEHWVGTASHTIAEHKCPTDTVGNPLRAVCVDTLGRRCQVGGDFMRARDENTFPISYFWELKPEKFGARKAGS